MRQKYPRLALRVTLVRFVKANEVLQDYPHLSVYFVRTSMARQIKFLYL